MLSELFGIANFGGNYAFVSLGNLSTLPIRLCTTISLHANQDLPWVALGFPTFLMPFIAPTRLILRVKVLERCVVSICAKPRCAVNLSSFSFRQVCFQLSFFVASATSLLAALLVLVLSFRMSSFYNAKTQQRKAASRVPAQRR